MKKLFFSGLITLILLYSFPQAVYAIYDPATVPNNKFGMHIVDENDLPDVKNLVNSGGGDWGYVTLVIQQGDRNKDKWQKIMNKLRHDHLIPIIRVATRPQGEVWEKPTLGDIDGWVSFLNSLNWVIKNRYVTIANEPNHAKEWGGEINPEEYTEYLKNFTEKLKNASSDFFVMNAGLDASAPNSKDTMDEELYLKRMYSKDNNIFNIIDGWSSHSYPNPNFEGSPDDNGKGTVKTYEWELNLLKSYGLTKNLPVFITETGWTHTDSNTQKVADNFREAFNFAWSDQNVIAVTPFILNYIDKPFDSFSWKKKDGSFYEMYQTVKDISKTKGEPIQISSGTIILSFIPEAAAIWNITPVSLVAVNTGQSIWTKDEIALGGNTLDDLRISSLIPNEIEPGEAGLIIGNAKLGKLRKLYTTQYIQILKGTEAISNKFYFDVVVDNLKKETYLQSMFNKLEVIVENMLQGK